jgi:hypothetical protein
MSTIVTRASKGSPLTHNEVDANFTNLNTDKAELNSPTFTGTVALPSTTSVGSVSATEIGYLDGVTSAIQTQLNAKGAGSVTTISIVSANGFAGTVANATTTPAITLSTSITGILKGNGTTISAASSGTDYAPATSGSFILSGNGSGAFSNVTIGTGLDFTGGTLSATGGGGSGTVTSVSGTGTVNGISLSGTVTTSGSLTLGGTLSGVSLTTQVSGTLPIANGGTGATSLAGASIVTYSGTETLTNKRITPRVSTTTSSATPTINTDNVDFYGLTAQAVDITSFTTNLSGTPTNGQKLWIYIVGTAARAITWGASFEASTAALPTTTVSTDRLDVGFVWNAATSKWRCVAVA